MRRRLPLRWRLTLWYALLITVAMAGFGLALFVGLRLRLHTTFDEQLRDQAVLTRSSVRLQGGALIVDSDEAADPRKSRHFVRLLGLDGRVLADTSARLGTVPLDPALVAVAGGGATELSTFESNRGAVRIVTTPIYEGNAIAGVLQVGMSRHEVDESLVGLLASFGVATPIVLLLAAGGAYLLAGRALAPVTAITGLAAQIGESDLHTRLALDLPRDEIGRLADTFNAMLARIESAFTRQRQFTDDAAHELRTPLSLMQSQIDLALARPRADEEYREALSVLDATVKRLSGLVATLLALTRADSGQLGLRAARFDLADTVSVVLEQYADAAAAEWVVLRSEATPTPVAGDEDLLVQVLVNLIDNALAHTPAGGTIALGCRSMGEQAMIWLSDTGTGIAEEHVGRVFDRFYRVDRGRDRTRGGAGLGLAICRAIVEAHGGEISLRSTVGRGTTVQILLPATPAARAGPASGAPARPGSPVASTPIETEGPATHADHRHRPDDRPRAPGDPQGRAPEGASAGHHGGPDRIPDAVRP